MYFIARFCPRFFGESEIWFTIWISLEKEIGCIVHHVLKNQVALACDSYNGNSDSETKCGADTRCAFDTTAGMCLAAELENQIANNTATNLMQTRSLLGKGARRLAGHLWRNKPGAWRKQKPGVHYDYSDHYAPSGALQLGHTTHRKHSTEHGRQKKRQVTLDGPGDPDEDPNGDC